MAAQASRKAVSHPLPADSSQTIARQLTAARVAARSPRRGAAYLLDGLEAAAHLCRECSARSQHEVVRVFAVEARATLIVPAGGRASHRPRAEGGRQRHRSRVRRRAAASARQEGGSEAAARLPGCSDSTYDWSARSCAAQSAASSLARSMALSTVQLAAQQRPHGACRGGRRGPRGHSSCCRATLTALSGDSDGAPAARGEVRGVVGAPRRAQALFDTSAGVSDLLSTGCWLEYQGFPLVPMASPVDIMPRASP